MVMWLSGQFLLRIIVEVFCVSCKFKTNKWTRTEVAAVADANWKPKLGDLVSMSYRGAVFGPLRVIRLSPKGRKARVQCLCCGVVFTRASTALMTPCGQMTYRWENKTKGKEK